MLCSWIIFLAINVNDNLGHIETLIFCLFSKVSAQIYTRVLLSKIILSTTPNCCWILIIKNIVPGDYAYLWSLHCYKVSLDMSKKKILAYAKTKTQISFAVTAKLISAFVFATWIVQLLFYINPKFHASSHLLWLYSLVCVGPGRKPRRPFSRNEAQVTRRIL